MAYKDKQKLREYQAWYRSMHREKAKATTRLWYKQNKDRAQKWGQEYYSKNQDRRRERSRADYHGHLEERKQSRAKWRGENKERIKVQNANWRRLNPEVRLNLARKREALKRKGKIGDTKAITAWLKSWRCQLVVRCFWCQREVSAQECHQDHVMPLAKGGAHSLENLVISCADCNTRKKDKHPDEWRAQLKSTRQPPG